MLVWFTFFKVYFITRVSGFVYFIQFFWGLILILELVKARFCFHSNTFRSRFLIMNFHNIRRMFWPSLKHVCSSRVSLSALSVSIIYLYRVEIIYFPITKETTVPKMLLNLDIYLPFRQIKITAWVLTWPNKVNIVLYQSRYIIWKY